MIKKWIMPFAFIVSAILLIVVVAIRYGNCCTDKEETDNIITEEREIFGIGLDGVQIDTCKVGQGESLSTILDRYDISSRTIHNLGIASEDVFDVRNIRAGQPYMVLRTVKDSVEQLSHLIYGIDKVNHVVFNVGDSLYVERHAKEVIVTTKNIVSTITSSFWNAVVGNGVSSELVLRVADVYQWTVDFYAIGKGDSFNIIYDERSIDGEVVGIGEIKGAWFNHNGRRYHAVLMQDDEHNGYWDETGSSLKKAFLKAPLRFTRISSGYSNSRFHPVLRIYRPHHGVDYAAPMGTPVEAVADGVVTFRAYKGQNGNMIKIKHNFHGGRYMTGYLHLRGFAKGLTVGSKVMQGQVIGYVGSTGISTGPHLDYRVWANGRPINPLKMNQEPGEPLKGEVLERFMPVKDSILNELNQFYAQYEVDQDTLNKDTLSNNKLAYE